MQIEMTKSPGGIFIPASDLEQEKTVRFKTGELYTVDIKLTRNPAFHRKMFAFFNFCFQYWSSDTEHLNEHAQFDLFRKQLLILAGFRVELINIRTKTLTLEAESIGYANMTPERFEQCYLAVTNAAMKHVFKTADQNTYNQLISFF